MVAMRVESSFMFLNKNKPKWTVYARVPRDFYEHDLKYTVPIYDSEAKAIVFVDQETAKKLLEEGYRVKIEIVPPPPVPPKSDIEVRRRRGRRKAKEQEQTQSQEATTQTQEQAPSQGQEATTQTS